MCIYKTYGWPGVVKVTLIWHLWQCCRTTTCHMLHWHISTTKTLLSIISTGFLPNPPQTKIMVPRGRWTLVFCGCLLCEKPHKAMIVWDQFADLPSNGREARGLSVATLPSPAASPAWLPAEPPCSPCWPPSSAPASPWRSWWSCCSPQKLSGSPRAHALSSPPGASAAPPPGTGGRWRSEGSCSSFTQYSDCRW